MIEINNLKPLKKKYTTAGSLRPPPLFFSEALVSEPLGPAREQTRVAMAWWWITGGVVMARFGPRVPLISLVVRSPDTVTAIISSYDHLVPQRGLALHVGSCPSGPSSPSGRTSSSSCCRSRTRPRPPPWPRLPRRASTRRGARREGGRDDESVNAERDDAEARPPGSSPLALFRWPTAPIAILATRRRPRRRDDDRWTARSDGADP